MATGYGVCAHIVYGHRAIFVWELGEGRAKSYGGCAEFVCKSCDAGADSAQGPRGDGAV